MKTKEQVVKFLVKNCMDADGDIDLSCLDFSKLHCNVIISGMKVDGNLYSSMHTVTGNLNQSCQTVDGDLYQDCQEVGGKLYQDGDDDIWEPDGTDDDYEDLDEILNDSIWDD